MMARQEVAIGSHIIGDGRPVAIVAEIGVNHLGDLGRAKAMVDAAVAAGADLLKFQTYLADQRYHPRNPKYREFTERVGAWQLSRRDETALWQHARDLGATVFTSPFDEESLDFADDLGAVAYKVAAFELPNRALLRRIAAKGKPVVFSRGMATFAEVDDTVALLQSHGVGIVILHTVSSYPLEKRFSNLRMIHALRERYPWPVGHSDHTPGTDIPPLAVAAGAVMIEKHFTMTPKYRESDNFFSITPDDLRELVFKVRQAERWLGVAPLERQPTEDYMWDFRRETA